MKIKTIVMFLPLIVGCLNSSELPISLHYQDEVTVTNDFYGSRCCTVEKKHNKSTYTVFCINSVYQLQAHTYINGVDATLTPGCVK